MVCDLSSVVCRLPSVVFLFPSDIVCHLSSAICVVVVWCLVCVWCRLAAWTVPLCCVTRATPFTWRGVYRSTGLPAALDRPQVRGRLLGVHAQRRAHGVRDPRARKCLRAAVPRIVVLTRTSTLAVHPRRAASSSSSSSSSSLSLSDRRRLAIALTAALKGAAIANYVEMVGLEVIERGRGASRMASRHTTRHHCHMRGLRARRPGRRERDRRALRRQADGRRVRRARQGDRARDRRVDRLSQRRRTLCSARERRRLRGVGVSVTAPRSTAGYAKVVTLATVRRDSRAAAVGTEVVRRCPLLNHHTQNPLVATPPPPHCREGRSSTRRGGSTTRRRTRRSARRRAATSCCRATSRRAGWASPTSAPRAARPCTSCRGRATRSSARPTRRVPRRRRLAAACPPARAWIYRVCLPWRERRHRQTPARYIVGSIHEKPSREERTVLSRTRTEGCLPSRQLESPP